MVPLNWYPSVFSQKVTEALGLDFILARVLLKY